MIDNQKRSHGKLPESITTERLLLRRWLPEDSPAFAAINADQQVMEYFPDVLPAESSDAMVGRIQQQFDEHCFGLWAVEVPSVIKFAGFIGLMVPRFDAHFTPCIEIGWRLAAEAWGKGYATEGANAALDFAFDLLHADEVVSMTTVKNQRSRRVMQKLGMTHDPADNFMHPLVPAESHIAPHVLYRLPAKSHRLLRS